LSNLQGVVPRPSTMASVLARIIRT
jgi:hypothetical protein